MHTIIVGCSWAHHACQAFSSHFHVCVVKPTERAGPAPFVFTPAIAHLQGRGSGGGGPGHGLWHPAATWDEPARSDAGGRKRVHGAAMPGFFQSPVDPPCPAPPRSSPPPHPPHSPAGPPAYLPPHPVVHDSHTHCSSISACLRLCLATAATGLFRSPPSTPQVCVAYASREATDCKPSKAGKARHSMRMHGVCQRPFSTEDPQPHLHSTPQS